MNEAICRKHVFVPTEPLIGGIMRWGQKNHILVDCITGLPIFEMTTTADASDSTVAKYILGKITKFLSVDGCTFIADKAHDVKDM